MKRYGAFAATAAPLNVEAFYKRRSRIDTKTALFGEKNGFSLSNLPM
ncbi:hypothetical protein [Sodalis sp. RH16]